MKTSFFYLLIVAGALSFLAGCGNNPKKSTAKAARQTVPDVAYQQPLVITRGGKYTGNYKSTDPKTPAIWIQTGEPVEITGCIIASAGEMIHCSGGTQANIHHNSLYGINPGKTDQWPRALNNYQPKTLVFENNFIEHSGGILVDHADSSSRSVVIRYNIIRNTDKRKGDLSTGEHRAAIQFNSVLRISGEIAWNQIENRPDSSFVEDNINMFNSGGTARVPYLIHDNYIFGAYPYPLSSADYVGSGITIDGDPAANTKEKMSQFINAFKNQVISTCNASMNIAAGHDIHFYENTMISSGMYPDGTKSERFWGGCCIWNASKVPKTNFVNNTIKNNTIGYVREDRNIPLPGRQDWVVVEESPLSVKAGDNISLPNPITLKTEEAEWVKWQDKLKQNRIGIGN